MKMIKRLHHGFTLIEVLVVLLIISIVTSVALLTIGRNDNRELEQFANELTQLLTLAEEHAMLQPTVLGLTLKERSFQFASFQAVASKGKNPWSPLQDTILGRHAIPQDIGLKVALEGQSEGKAIANTPQIIISTNGDITPFTIYIGKRGERPRYAIKGDADGHVTNTLLS